MSTSFSNNIKPDERGSAACGVTISIQELSGEKSFQIGRPIGLSIRIKNVSQNQINLVDQDTNRDFTFSVTSPSGKELVPIIPKQSAAATFRTKYIKLKPEEVREYKLAFREIYDFKEPGKYKIVVNREIYQSDKKPCEATSNPLEVGIFGITKDI